MSIYEASPLSRKDIRNFVNDIRKVMGLTDTRYFPIREFLEFVMPQMDENFVLEILPKHEMGSNHGLAYPEDKVIKLREDVYDGAVAGKPRDRLTMAHEIGHYFLHTKERISFARNREKSGQLPAYRDPEWQANAFAGELLAPPHIIQGMSVFEVMQNCGVSQDAARIQLKSINK
ncbi:ImmA/IrrE family metallo-endopeptidase [Paenibacillus sp. VCA1]|uniref:ImmA/IrrE family metallo-endopeptidase n=1 Tax=Paenibacillus sp. VCA1 TaxID=3039148 RepID=UPI0028718A82|nr:ImmA/IrrE family metallo-endopeptidase [Paenibacillus sp. VCA1]MDR9857831.1 ImmA/IrrE family metallo-endopeptidase [Paenibacillus sp. VCA1]